MSPWDRSSLLENLQVTKQNSTIFRNINIAVLKKTLWENREVRERIFEFLFLWRHRKYFFSHGLFLCECNKLWENSEINDVVIVETMANEKNLSYASPKIIPRRARDFMLVMLCNKFLLLQKKISCFLLRGNIWRTLIIDCYKTFSVEKHCGPAMSQRKTVVRYYSIWKIVCSTTNTSGNFDEFFVQINDAYDKKSFLAI